MGLRIVLLGGPGAGKGTQANRIVQREGLAHISTGDIFREHLTQNTDIGQEIEGYMKRGGLVPDELTCRIVAQRLAEEDCKNGYILDGFPRSLPQAEDLEQMVHNIGKSISVAIELRIGDDEIVRRLTARRNCPKCKKIYNLLYSPPKSPEHCDDCEDERLEQRSDDEEETIRERLKIYHEKNQPIVAFFEERNLLRSIECEGLGPDDIASEIESILAPKAR